MVDLKEIPPPDPTLRDDGQKPDPVYLGFKPVSGTEIFRGNDLDAIPGLNEWCPLYAEKGFF